VAEAAPARPKERPAAAWTPLGRLVVKTVLLLLVLNAAVLPFDVVASAGRLSLYNSLVPGRLRLPYADDPARAFNVSVTQLDALFRSHVLSAPARQEEMRVIVLGDSSVWGFRLGPQETLAAQLNHLGLRAGGRTVSFYNVGYPTMSLTKDLLLLRRALDYRPDVIVWLVTLESFPVELQAVSPLVRFNRREARAALTQSGVDPSRYLPTAEESEWWTNTVAGRRRELAELFRLQVFGLMWAATGIDYDADAAFALRAEDLESDPTFHGQGPGSWPESALAWDILEAGIRAAGDIPILIVNEPTFVSHGANSDMRYNFLYPRWAFDSYRSEITDRCRAQGWTCLDLWDALPGEAFTDSAVHYNPAGAETLAELLADSILETATRLEPVP
jgi:hypothetical protein